MKDIIYYELKELKQLNVPDMFVYQMRQQIVKERESLAFRRLRFAISTQEYQRLKDIEKLALLIALLGKETGYNALTDKEEQAYLSSDITEVFLTQYFSDFKEKETLFSAVHNLLMINEEDSLEFTYSLLESVYRDAIRLWNVNATGKRVMFTQLGELSEKSLQEEINRTFFIIKPDGVRKHFESVMNMLQENGFYCDVLTYVEKLPTELLEQHYAHIKDKPYFQPTIEYMQSGGTIIGVAYRENAVESMRKLVGETNPLIADKNTIRGKFGTVNGDIIENVIHASDSKESVSREIELWLDLLERTENEK